MSKIGLPYLPSTLVWTKKSLDKYPLVYPTYLSKKFGHFGIKSCQSFLPYFLRFLTRIFFRSLSISVRREILKLMKVLNLDIQTRRLVRLCWDFDNSATAQDLQDFFSRPPYQYQKYKYGHPYLTYLPQIFLSKLFFQKKFGSKVPYLPTVWTYVQNFVVFFIWDPLLI